MLTQEQEKCLVIYLTSFIDMERDYFLNRVSCEFAVITNDKDCHMVTKELDIHPIRFFNKGDTYKSKHSGSLITRPYGLWAIQSDKIISEELDVSSHIRYFQELFRGKIITIEKLKNHHYFECVFTIAIETEDAGAGFDLNEKELYFIKQISSRYSCTFISKESIT